MTIATSEQEIKHAPRRTGHTRSTPRYIMCWRLRHIDAVSPTWRIAGIISRIRDDDICHKREEAMRRARGKSAAVYATAARCYARTLHSEYNAQRADAADMRTRRAAAGAGRRVTGCCWRRHALPRYVATAAQDTAGKMRYMLRQPMPAAGLLARPVRSAPERRWYASGASVRRSTAIVVILAGRGASLYGARHARRRWRIYRLRYARRNTKHDIGTGAAPFAVTSLFVERVAATSARRR